MVRKHQGIVQTGGNTGRLRKGYRYSGKKLKNGLSQIIKVKKSKTRKNITKKRGGSKEFEKIIKLFAKSSTITKELSGLKGQNFTYDMLEQCNEMWSHIEDLQNKFLNIEYKGKNNKKYMVELKQERNRIEKLFDINAMVSHFLTKVRRKNSGSKNFIDFYTAAPLPIILCQYMNYGLGDYESKYFPRGKKHDTFFKGNMQETLKQVNDKYNEIVHDSSLHIDKTELRKDLISLNLSIFGGDYDIFGGEASIKYWLDGDSQLNFNSVSIIKYLFFDNGWSNLCPRFLFELINLSKEIEKLEYHDGGEENEESDVVKEKKNIQAFMVQYLVDDSIIDDIIYISREYGLPISSEPIAKKFYSKKNNNERIKFVENKFQETYDKKTFDKYFTKIFEDEKYSQLSEKSKTCLKLSTVQGRIAYNSVGFNEIVNNNNFGFNLYPDILDDKNKPISKKITKTVKLMKRALTLDFNTLYRSQLESLKDAYDLIYQIDDSIVINEEFVDNETSSKLALDLREWFISNKLGSLNDESIGGSFKPYEYDNLTGKPHVLYTLLQEFAIGTLESEVKNYFESQEEEKYKNLTPNMIKQLKCLYLLANTETETFAYHLMKWNFTGLLTVSHVEVPTWVSNNYKMMLSMKINETPYNFSENWGQLGPHATDGTYFSFLTSE